MKNTLLLLTVLSAGLIFCAGIVSCGERSDTEVDHMHKLDEGAVKQQIALLSEGAKTDDADAEFRYYQAIEALTAMGSEVEPFLLFEMKNGRDWAVRRGCISVLDGIGSKKCVTPLIECLLDEHPLVVQKAMYSLRVFCNHQIVPNQDMPGAAVPPIPQRQAGESFDRDFQLWVDWCTVNQQALHHAWAEWWRDNRGEVKIE